jgi:hypothetical protein
LNSARYAEVFNETRTMGSLNSAVRTADQTLYALFWNASTATYFWLSGSLSQQTTAQDVAAECTNPRLAQHCDGGCGHRLLGGKVLLRILATRNRNSPGCLRWECGDDARSELCTFVCHAAHPEYPSGHSTVSSSATRVLTHFFGERTSFSMTSDVMLGVVRSFSSFSDALHEVMNARVFAGIHFRTACEDGEVTGTAVADYILTNSLQPVEDDD